MDTPDELRLTRALLDSSAPALARRRPDPLATVESAGQWMTGIVASWTSPRGLPTPELVLQERDLVRLRELRDELRTRTADLTVTVTLSVSPDGIRATPVGDGLAWIEAALATEALESAPGTGVYRVKVCRNPDCGVSFIDHSRNNSRVWHDTATCGNTANVRSFRTRANTEKANP